VDGVLAAQAVVLPGSTRALAGELSVPDGMTLEQIECAILESKLRTNGGNRTLTADQLGLSRRTIQRKIKEHKLPY
jgi:DNA-binding protein Fis